MRPSSPAVPIAVNSHRLLVKRDKNRITNRRGPHGLLAIAECSSNAAGAVTSPSRKDEIMLNSICILLPPRESEQFTFNRIPKAAVNPSHLFTLPPLEQSCCTG